MTYITQYFYAKPVAPTAFLYILYTSKAVSRMGGRRGHQFDWPRKMHPRTLPATTNRTPTASVQRSPPPPPARFYDRSEALVPASGSYLIHRPRYAGPGKCSAAIIGPTARDRPADPAWSGFPLSRDRNTTAVPETRQTRDQSRRGTSGAEYQLYHLLFRKGTLPRFIYFFITIYLNLRQTVYC